MYLILKYSQLAGAGDDILNLYVNPVIANGVPATPDATTSSGTDQSGTIDRLVFRQNATATPTAGGSAYGTGTAYAFTSAGTAGQVLTSNGASAPTWNGIDGGTFS